MNVLMDLLRRVRGALGMGLTWAVWWGIGGFLFELILNILPGNDLGHIVDMWPQFLAMVGFPVGVAFSVVLGIAARHRGFNELSIPTFTLWGALAGALLGGLAIAAGAAPAWNPLWLRAAVIIGSPTLLSAGAAAGTLALARMAEQKASLGGGGDRPGIQG